MKSDPNDLDRHFIDLNEYMDDLTEITEEEQEFGLKFLKGLGVYLENPEMLEISATPEAVFCLVVKTYRRSKF